MKNGKMLICPECGLDVHSDYKMCPRCGARIESEDDKRKIKYRKEAKRWKNKALGQRQVLDKIKAEIKRQEKWLWQAGINPYNVDIAFSSIKSVFAESEEI